MVLGGGVECKKLRNVEFAKLIASRISDLSLGVQLLYKDWISDPSTKINRLSHFLLHLRSCCSACLALCVWLPQVLHNESFYLNSLQYASCKLNVQFCCICCSSRKSPFPDHGLHSLPESPTPVFMFPVYQRVHGCHQLLGVLDSSATARNKLPGNGDTCGSQREAMHGC